METFTLATSVITAVECSAAQSKITLATFAGGVATITREIC